MEEEDLIRETAKVFGIGRAGPKVKAFVREGVDLLEKEGRCREKGGKLSLL